MSDTLEQANSTSTQMDPDLVPLLAEPIPVLEQHLASSSSSSSPMQSRHTKRSPVSTRFAALSVCIVVCAKSISPNEPIPTELWNALFLTAAQLSGVKERSEMRQDGDTHRDGDGRLAKSMLWMSILDADTADSISTFLAMSPSLSLTSPLPTKSYTPLVLPLTGSGSHHVDDVSTQFESVPPKSDVSIHSARYEPDNAKIRTPASTLPNELLITIFIYLTRSPKSLYACVLTCRRWCGVATPILYRSPYFQSPESITLFVRSVAKEVAEKAQSTSTSPPCARNAHATSSSHHRIDSNTSQSYSVLLPYRARLVRSMLFAPDLSGSLDREARVPHMQHIDGVRASHCSLFRYFVHRRSTALANGGVPLPPSAPRAAEVAPPAPADDANVDVAAPGTQPEIANNNNNQPAHQPPAQPQLPPITPLIPGLMPVPDALFYLLPVLFPNLETVQEYGLDIERTSRTSIDRLIRTSPQKAAESWHALSTPTFALTLMLRSCRRWLTGIPEWRGFGLDLHAAISTVTALLDLLQGEFRPIWHTIGSETLRTFRLLVLPKCRLCLSSVSNTVLLQVQFVTGASQRLLDCYCMTYYSAVGIARMLSVAKLVAVAEGRPMDEAVNVSGEERSGRGRGQTRASERAGSRTDRSNAGPPSQSGGIVNSVSTSIIQGTRNDRDNNANTTVWNADNAEDLPGSVASGLSPALRPRAATFTTISTAASPIMSDAATSTDVGVTRSDIGEGSSSGRDVTDETPRPLRALTPLPSPSPSPSNASPSEPDQTSPNDQAIQSDGLSNNSSGSHDDTSPTDSIAQSSTYRVDRGKGKAPASNIDETHGSPSFHANSDMPKRPSEKNRIAAIKVQHALAILFNRRLPPDSRVRSSPTAASASSASAPASASVVAPSLPAVGLTSPLETSAPDAPVSTSEPHGASQTSTVETTGANTTPPSSSTSASTDSPQDQQPQPSQTANLPHIPSLSLSTLRDSILAFPPASVNAETIELLQQATQIDYNMDEPSGIEIRRWIEWLNEIVKWHVTSKQMEPVKDLLRQSMGKIDQLRGIQRRYGLAFMD